MSLFGGPLPPPDEAPYFRSSSLSLRSSPPLVSSPPLIVENSFAPHPDDASDANSDAESDASDRPNRFKGKWHQYRRLIKEERRVTSAVARERDGDLGLHLYNAHALKRRAQAGEAAANAKPWQSKNRWIEEDNEEAFVPPQPWTAWPLEPFEVPRPQQRDALDPDDEFTLRPDNYGTQKPSQDMEDIFVAMVLKNAKERWLKRKWEDEPEAEATREPEAEAITEPEAESIREPEAESIREPEAESTSEAEAESMSEPEEESMRTPPTSRRSSRIASRATKEGVASGATEERVASRATEEEHSQMDSDSDSDAEGSSRGASAATPTGPRPTVMADDDKARRILQPIVRSTLANLDDLLMALHHSRQNHYNQSLSADDNETDTDAPQGRSRKRRKLNEDKPTATKSRGRPPKPILRVPAGHPTPDAAGADDGDHGSARKRKQGRPRKYLERLPGESHYMMKKRHAQLEAAGQLDPASEPEAKPEASTSKAPTPRASSPAGDSRSSRSGSTSSSDDGTESEQEGTGRHGKHGVGLQDWSEVLSVASMRGAFSPAVIERAARRCANLFGEGMTFRVLDEGKALEQPGELVEYVPELVPPPDLVESEEEEEEEQQEEEQAEEQEEEEEEEEEGNSDDGKPAWDGVSLTCPHVDCSRHTNAFSIRWRLKEHVRRSHGYELEAKSERGGMAKGKGKHRKTLDNEEGEADGDSGLVGAVHNDGFMNPLAAHRGWRGKDKKKSEKRTMASNKRRKSKSKSI